MCQCAVVGLLATKRLRILNGPTNCCFDIFPRTLDVSEVFDDAALATFQGVGECANGKRGRFLSPTLILQGANLVVDVGCQKVVLEVQLGDGLDRVFANGRKFTHQIAHVAFCHRNASSDSTQSRGKVVASDRASLGQSRCSFTGRAVSTSNGSSLACDQGQLAAGDTGSITGRNQRPVELVYLLRALEVCEAKGTNRGQSHIQWCQQAPDSATQSTNGWYHATEYVLQLTALLQQDRQRRLATLQRHHNVGQLGWHLAQGRSGLLGAQAVLVERNARALLGACCFLDCSSFGFGGFGCGPLRGFLLQ